MASVNNISSAFNPEAPANFSVQPTESVTRSYRKKLRPKIARRLIGICFFGCLTGYLVFDSPYWMAGIWTALATAALFYETVRFVDQSERKLISFLQSLNQNDFSVTFYENKKSADYDLHRAFNQLNETYRTLRSDKEAQHQLLQVIVATATIPMICFRESTGEIWIINDAAKQLLNIPFANDIKSLWRVDAGLPNFIREMLDGEKESLKLTLNGKQTFLSVTSRHIVFKDQQLKLITFHDVSSELAARESETWQKLLRVLTHEISNSAIPLSTLSSYIYDLISKSQNDLSQLNAEDRNDIIVSLKTIEQRSRSLKEFVTNFRSVNQVPEPDMKKIPMQEFLNEVTSLFSRELEKENIRLDVQALKEPVVVFADKNLTMQVLINLVKNAVEAMSNLKENKRISLSCERVGRYASVHVGDTGSGIDPEILEQIFIPFFSTKKTGSGIGLSISQQIMQKQRGDISVRSAPGKGTVFTLTFSC